METGANWNYLYFLIQVYFSPTFRATRVKNPLGDGRAISPFMPLRNDNWHCQSQSTPFPSRKKNAHKQGVLISRPKHPCTLRWGAFPRTAMYKLLLGAGATITEDGERICLVTSLEERKTNWVPVKKSTLSPPASLLPCSTTKSEILWCAVPEPSSYLTHVKHTIKISLQCRNVMCVNRIKR